MHTHLLATTVWRWRQGQPVEPLLKRIAAEETVLISSGGSDWLDSSGKAEKVDGGFRVTARKIFSSGCPMGDLLVTSAYPQNLFGHLSWACGSLSLGRGRGVRGFAAWRTPLKPLTLTLSQRERGYERMAKKVSCFCTRAPCARQLWSLTRFPATPIMPRIIAWDIS
jgi:hypothetical protein